MGQSSSSNATLQSSGSTEQSAWTDVSTSGFKFIPLCDDYMPKKRRPALRSTRLGLKSSLYSRRRRWLTNEFYSSNSDKTTPQPTTTLLPCMRYNFVCRKRTGEREFVHRLGERNLRLLKDEYRNPVVRPGGDMWTLRNVRGFTQVVRPRKKRSFARPVLTHKRPAVKPWKFVTATGYCWQSSNADIKRRRHLIMRTRESLRTQYEELTNDLLCLTKPRVRQRKPIGNSKTHPAPSHVWSTIYVNDTLKATVRFDHVVPKDRGDVHDRSVPYTVRDLQRDYKELLGVLYNRSYPHISIQNSSSKELWETTPLTGVCASQTLGDDPREWKLGNEPLVVKLKCHPTGGSLPSAERLAQCDRCGNSGRI